jgi:uncharacterized membrane protein
MTSVSSLKAKAGHGAQGGGGLASVPVWAWLLAAGLVAYGVATALILSSWEEAPRTFRLDATPLLNAGLMIQVHLAGAVAAFGLGLVILALPKGTGLHKPLGWAWVGLMALTAVSSFFIRELFNGGFSPIHALSAWVVVALPMGVAAIRGRRVAAHRRTMTGVFLGGLMIAGLFTLLPGRLLWSVFFGA